MNAVLQQGASGVRVAGAASGVRASGSHLRLVPSAVPAPAGASLGFARRRFAAIALLVLVVVGGVLAGRAMAASDEPMRVRVTVTAGETLSDIAVREMPGVRAQEAVVEIQRANNLASAQVDVGQVLVIPAA